MRGAAFFLVALVVAGCASPPPPHPPAETFLDRFRECKGQFPDGTAFDCADAVPVASIEPAVPAGWQEVGGVETVHDTMRFYRSPSIPGDPIGLGTGWGIWFDLAPRSEGDFATSRPTQYGGVACVADGRSVAWQSEASRGFVRAPQETDVQLERQTVHFVVHVPVPRGTIPGVEGALIRPIWFHGPACQDPTPLRAVLETHMDTRVYYVHEAPGVNRVGHTLGWADGEAEAVLHIYQVLSGMAPSELSARL